MQFVRYKVDSCTRTQSAVCWLCLVVPLLLYLHCSLLKHFAGYDCCHRLMLMASFLCGSWVS
jgi:hypothetical protein